MYFFLQTAKLTLGSKPCLIFVGEPFETDPEMMRLKNLFIGQLMLVIKPLVDGVSIQ